MKVVVVAGIPGFREFIEYLQKMGELHNILRMIDSFYSMNGMDCSELDTGHYNVEKGGFDMLLSFGERAGSRFERLIGGERTGI